MPRTNNWERIILQRWIWMNQWLSLSEWDKWGIYYCRLSLEDLWWLFAFSWVFMIWLDIFSEKLSVNYIPGSIVFGQLYFKFTLQLFGSFRYFYNARIFSLCTALQLWITITVNSLLHSFLSEVCFINFEFRFSMPLNTDSKCTCTVTTLQNCKLVL